MFLKQTLTRLCHRFELFQGISCKFRKPDECFIWPRDGSKTTVCSHNDGKLNVKFRGLSELRFKNKAIIPDAEVYDLTEAFKQYILSCSILYGIISKLGLGAHACNLTVLEIEEKGLIQI